jgi:NADH:ubiquinone oxidoreductase subunit E
MVGGSPIVAQLREIQRAHGYIPVAALRELSERTGEYLYKLHGVISFFPHFRLQPPPPVEVLVCDDLS